MSQRLAWAASLVVLAVCTAGSFVAAAYADSLQSAHYQFVETDLGGGGLIPSSSANYQSTLSVGDNAIGESASPNYQSVLGSQTTADPTLSFTINNPNASFGNFSPGSAATATATFSVSDYTSYGYAVQIIGSPPSNGAHTIDAMPATDDSRPGVEQFGLNLVANTSPANFGANPDHGQFGFGSAAPNYGTSNKYRFVSGETIVTGPKSSGVTTYTMSYIVNVNSLTPGGQYAAKQTIVCTGTF